MKKGRKKIAAAFLTAIFAYFGVGILEILPCEANTPSQTTVDLTQSACVEFAQFSAYADTHRTRIVVAAGEGSWGSYSVNYSSPEWLGTFTVNGRTVAEYKSEYDAAPFELNSSDLYISTYGGAPISVTLDYDETLAANVVELSIPEAFIPASEMRSVGLLGGMVYSYEADEPRVYAFTGSFHTEKPVPPPQTYTVTLGDETLEVAEGELLTAPMSPTKAETEQFTYQFVGWYYTVEEEKIYWNFDTDRVQGELVLLAEFRAIEKVKYTVVFEPENGGEGRTLTVTAGARIDASELPKNPTKAQTADAIFVFEGWFDADVGTPFDQNVPITANAVFVARYKRIATFLVTVDGVTSTALEGERLSKPARIPTREATESHTYEFIGWCYNKEGEDIYWDFDADTVSFDVVLEAGFKAVEKPKYAATFDCDNGTPPTVVEVYEGAYIKPEQLPAAPQKPQSGNTVYSFECWSADGVAAWDFARDAVTAPVFLKAYYTTETVYTVSFDGATHTTYNAGDKLTKPSDPVKPSTTEYDYAFTGWYYLVGEELILWNFEQDTVKADVALVSQYAESKVCYTLYLYVDGVGVGIQRLAWDEPVVYPEIENKAWYDHLGWVDEGGESAPSVMPKRDLAVYANWGYAEYTATLLVEYATLYTLPYTLETAEQTVEALKVYLAQANDERYAYAWTEGEPTELPANDCSFPVTATKRAYRLTVIADPEDAEGTTTSYVLSWDDELKLPELEPQRGRRFLAWKTESEEYVPAKMPTCNLTVRAEWIWVEYTMTVVDGDGQEHSFSYTVREADDAAYVKALFDAFLISENASAYVYAWETPPPALLPLESGGRYEVVKTPVEYTLTFEHEDVAAIKFTVETLSSLVLPDVPSREGYVGSWDKTLADIGLSDITFKPVYEKLPEPEPPEDSSSSEALPEDSSSSEAPPEDSSSSEAPPEDSSSSETLPEDSSLGETLPEDSSSSEAPPEGDSSMREPPKASSSGRRGCFNGVSACGVLLIAAVTGAASVRKKED